MIRYSYSLKEDLEVCILSKKIKHSNIPRDRFFEWLQTDRETKYVFVHYDKGDIDAYMVLVPRVVDGENRLLLYSTYVPVSNGLTKEFNDTMEQFAKSLGLYKIQSRVTRNPDSMIRKWGFKLDSYIITKELTNGKSTENKTTSA